MLVPEKADEDTDIWVMESEGIWMRVPNDVDPNSPILCTPVNTPRRRVADAKVVVAQAPTCPIVEEDPYSDDEDGK